MGNHCWGYRLYNRTFAAPGLHWGPGDLGRSGPRCRRRLTGHALRSADRWAGFWIRWCCGAYQGGLAEVVGNRERLKVGRTIPPGVRRSDSRNTRKEARIMNKSRRLRMYFCLFCCLWPVGWGHLEREDGYYTLVDERAPYCRTALEVKGSIFDGR